ncbi:SusC/RagA family TonB-linked outer membrane protein [Allomuricauda sp. CP2A]|jgi:TonB-linked SusC/RagA family outer membrane protein|uniref:SusC/RagA family TonB-linked outer membrane protein n=1 Tax=Allomuricauda sp. CP2A TaxID=1848189 RepID=UPI0009F2CF9B|nr:TonB-dependent receptor [Muricauda sp. CP2A]
MKKQLTRLTKMALLPILLLCAHSFVHAQEQLTVTGSVTDTQGTPLPGASIVIQGTQQGTTSDFDGNFQLDGVPSNGQLMVSYIGFVQLLVDVDNRSSIDIVLSEDNNLLDEVVVIGYQSVKRSEIVGSVSVVDTDEMLKAPAGNVGQMLQGRAAGVTVTSTGAPGTSSSVKIRGLNSFSGQDSPLYVVDGMLISALGSDFNPNDIESIQVLKDAAATALYGSRGMNGVIIVTTKKGRPGPLKVDYDFYYGFQTINKRLKLTNAAQFKEINDLAYTNNGDAPQNLREGVDTDWQEELFKTGTISEHNLNLSGGSENSNYFISLNYFDQEGAIIGPEFDRYQIRVNTQTKKGRFTFGENIAMSRSNQTRVNGNPFIDVVWMLPTIPVYDPNNESGYGYGDDNNSTFATNPIGLQEHYSNTAVTSKVLGSAFAEFEIFPFLKYKLNLGLDYAQIREKYYQRAGALRQNTPGAAFLDDRHTEFFNILAENTLNFNKAFGKHNITALVGYTTQKDNFTYNFAHTEGLSGEFWVQDNGTTSPRTEGREEVAGLRSFLGSFNYSFDDKYTLLFNFRRDGSSKFGKNNRYANFPSVSASWRISEEGFMENNGVFSNLKLRGSWGIVGNQAISNYATQSVLRYNQNYVLNNQVVPGATNLQLVNPNLRWESKTTTNIGVDMGFFQNRLSLTADYYIADVEDLLLAVPIPLSSGNTGGDPLANVGQVQNRGLELSLGYQNVINDFSFGVLANGTFLKNEVKALVEEAGNLPIFGQGQILRTAVGEPVASFYVLETAGIFQNQAEIDAWGVQPGARPGDVKYVDNDGNGVINFDDRTVVGKALPDFEYGLNLNFGYKGFDMTAFFAGVTGNSIFNEQKWWSQRYDDNANYLVDDVFWTGEGTSNLIPRPQHLDSSLNPTQNSDRYVEKGDYFRLKNLQIGYSFPEEVISKLSLNKLRLYMTGQNLFTITDYSGYDPEVVGANGNGDFLNRGFDNGNFPSLRTGILGIQIGF